MSNPYLPPEILDYIVDLLHDNPKALKECCLVSKPWIPRTRKHLFAHIEFRTARSLQSWQKTFPDPSSSPAYYTHTLICSQATNAVDTGAGSWIKGFSRVVHFDVSPPWPSSGKSMDSFVPFHGFSPVKSLRATFTVLLSSQLFNLILSFPLLEDLTVITHLGGLISDKVDIVAWHSNPLMFTGTLELSMEGGLEFITHRLLSLPGRIRFRKFSIKWLREKDTSLTTALLEGCSRTLESLEIACNLDGLSVRHLCLRR